MWQKFAFSPIFDSLFWQDLTTGRRARAREKLEREAIESQHAAAKRGHVTSLKRVTEQDISKEICRVDGERKIEFGKLEEGKLDFSRSQILYMDSLELLKSVDATEAQHAKDMLNGLHDREFEFEEMIAASNLAARNLWDERAEMLCRQVCACVCLCMCVYMCTRIFCVCVCVHVCACVCVIQIARSNLTVRNLWDNGVEMHGRQLSTSNLLDHMHIQICFVI